MGSGSFVTLMLMQQTHMRMEEENRRRHRREEEEAARRRREKRRREEEQRMIEHRKNSPVIYNEEEWQKDRCVKAISMQPSIERLIRAIEEERPKVIQAEEHNYDKQIIETGLQYEEVKRELESIIKSLKSQGITVDGDQTKLSKISSDNVNMTTPKQTTESFGSTFTINDKAPLELSSEILTNDDYYDSRYQKMMPDRVEENYIEATAKMKKYQKFGKYLRFLLKTRKYLELEEHTEQLAERYEICQQRKKEKESYESLSIEQLTAIKTYFQKLAQLTGISKRIKELFQEKSYVAREDNKIIYDASIKAVMEQEGNRELVDQVHTYISNIEANDETTMKEAYELVKGKYPIEIPSRFLYDLIIENMRGYSKVDPKQKINS